MGRRDIITIARRQKRTRAVLATAILVALPTGLAAQETGRAGQPSQQEQNRSQQEQNRRSGATATPQATAPNQQATHVTAGDLVDDPARYYGERVSVQAPVESVYSRSLFTVDEDKVWSTGEDLLVLNPRPAKGVTRDAQVTVTGVVHFFSRAEVERLQDDWKWDVRPDLIMQFGSRPVLIAESIRGDAGDQFVSAAPRTGQIASDDPRISASQGQADAADAGTSAIAPAMPAAVTAGNLADHPDRYFGKRVRVTADVEDIYTAKVFALDEDKLFSTGEDVLVVAPNLKKPVNEDMYVTVVGTVKRFSRTDRDLDVDGYGLRPNLASGFEDRPVIVATSIRTAAGEELSSAAR